MRGAWIVASMIVGLVGQASAGKKQIEAAKLEALRTAGTTDIAPDDLAAGHVVAGVLVCLGKTGKVTSAEIAASSGNEAYDAQVLAAIEATWKFRSYRVGKKKKKTAVCALFAVSGGQDPPPPPKRETVTPQALEAYRVSGDKNIVPDDATKADIQKAGKARVVVPVKLCVDVNGDVDTVKVLKSSGFPDYDTKIEQTMNTWKYQPFLVDGVAAPVCTAITFIYVQK